MRDPELEVVERRFGGRLEVEAKLGQGGMGAVYRVIWNGTTCALKVLLKSALDDEASMRRFLLEGRVLARLSHPAIIKVHELGESPDFPYILCEFVEGESLDVLIAREAPLPWDRALDLTSRILDGLGAAHAGDVIHRDIKPSNILVGKDGALKLADFGIAKAERLESKHTTTGMIVGTPAYIAPEVLRGEKPTPRADIFATGVVLYELLVGRLPWHNADAGALLTERITTTEIPTPSRFNSAVPRSLDGLVQMAMAPRTVDRYPTANTFRAAIESTRRQLVQNVGAPANTLELPAASRPSATAQLSRASRSDTRAVTHPGLAGDAVPPRLSQKIPRVAPAAAAERNLLPVAVACVALLGCVTVFAIHRSRNPAPREQTRGAISASVPELEGAAPSPSEQLLYEDLRAGTGSVQARAAAQAARMGERGAQLLHRAWSLASEDRRAPLRDALAECAHPLALRPLTQLIASPKTEPSRRDALAAALAERIGELESMSASPDGFPDRERAVNELCDVLAERAPSAPAVARAAIRAVGWLSLPATTAACFRAMQEAQSADPAANALLIKALARFDQEPARALAREGLEQLTPGSGPGLSGPAPGRPPGSR